MRITANLSRIGELENGELVSSANSPLTISSTSPTHQLTNSPTHHVIRAFAKKQLEAEAQIFAAHDRDMDGRQERCAARFCLARQRHQRSRFGDGSVASGHADFSVRLPHH